MVVGMGIVALSIDARSLKGKRSVVRQVTGRTSHRFNVGIAEVGAMDAHARADIGFTVVSNERAHADRMIASVFEYIEGLGVATVIERRSELVHFGGGSTERADLVGDWADFEEPEVLP